MPPKEIANPFDRFTRNRLLAIDPNDTSPSLTPTRMHKICRIESGPGGNFFSKPCLGISSREGALWSVVSNMETDHERPSIELLETIFSAPTLEQGQAD